MFTDKQKLAMAHLAREIQRCRTELDTATEKLMDTFEDYQKLPNWLVKDSVTMFMAMSRHRDELARHVDLGR